MSDPNFLIESYYNKKVNTRSPCVCISTAFHSNNALNMLQRDNRTIITKTQGCKYFSPPLVLLNGAKKVLEVNQYVCYQEPMGSVKPFGLQRASARLRPH